MSTGQKMLWIVVGIVLLGGGYWWWSVSQNMPAPAVSTTNTHTNDAAMPSQTSSAGVIAPMSATVTFDGSSFSPANVTIAQGGTVTWVPSGGEVWIASGPYPLDNGYDGTTLEQHCQSTYSGTAPFDECAGSTSDWGFTFNKVGIWNYYDQFDNAITGSVTVVVPQ